MAETSDMILTDTHTHLYYETDEQKLDELVQRALSADVSRMFLPNVDSASVPLVAQLAYGYPEHCFAMLGLHPCNVKEGFREELQQIKAAKNELTIYAVGEIGIDLYRDRSTLDFQEAAFREQIAWAKALDLPVVIHCRDAFNEVEKILSEEKSERLRGIFHCFTGTAEQAEKVIGLGFHLGIGGVVTYKNSGLAEVVAGIGLEHIVLETDAPYLSPAPFRGKPNESSYLVHIAQKVADIYHQSIEEVAAVTTGNSRKIFLR
jgi:TatD DNase family protein